MRIECTESVVVNNIIGGFIKQQPTIEKLIGNSTPCTVFSTSLQCGGGGGGGGGEDHADCNVCKTT